MCPAMLYTLTHTHTHTGTGTHHAKLVAVVNS